MKRENSIQICPQGCQYLIVACDNEEKNDFNQSVIIFDIEAYYGRSENFYKGKKILQAPKNSVFNKYNCLTDEIKETIILIKLKEGEEKNIYWSEWSGRETSITAVAKDGSVTGVFNGSCKIREIAKDFEK